MPDDHFDLKKVRRNWDLAVTPPAPAPPERLAEVRPALDPFVAAESDIARLRGLIAAELADHAETLAPFLGQLDRAVGRLRAATAAGPASVRAEGGEPPLDATEIREELDKALFDLEDLIEVFTMVRR